MEFYETRRLIVRPFRGSDAPQLLDYLADPTVNCFADERLANIEEAVAEVNKKQNDPSQFAVCLKDNDKLIGHLFAMQEEDTYSVGCNFNHIYHGQGFANEASSGLFDYLFNQKQARRIYCYVEESNLASQGLCRRLGMREEGFFKEYISFVNGVNGAPIYENTLQFAILKREWVYFQKDHP